MNDKLLGWRVPLRAADDWKKLYAITAIYLNDIAAGVLLEIPHDWKEENADKVAAGLRHLLGELFHSDLIRPVLAVFWPEKTGSTKGACSYLRRMTWDDELHRGDFTLREAPNEEAGKDLLSTLMGDSMAALDENARETDRAGIPEVLKALCGPTAANEPERRLVRVVCDHLERCEKNQDTPDLNTVLKPWVTSEGGA